MGTHTQGPWAWRDDYNFGKHETHPAQGLNAECENIEQGRMMLVSDAGEIVLSVWADYADDSGLSISKEDARVIEAAPRLLAFARAYRAGYMSQDLERLCAEALCQAEGKKIPIDTKPAID